ncbi:unnamed protein product [Adineta steineri]|uniref:G-protein coupled receptors family 1 profile domain-containing protein n=1 Tax=Adineta steineri TaxID=433720 RepID=A0A818U251_9BILA|nr:unnamed protein product [Adineta steineri]CAF3691215.1 unnamed protein product [Adineta steineri]
MLFYLIFFYPCEQSFDYTAYECGIPCYVKSQPIGLINEIIHIFLPVAMIIFFDVLILIRVIALKKRALSSSSTSNLWKQNSRMIMQLTAICVLTSLAWLPYVTGILLSIFKYPTFGSTEVFFHFAQATYVPCLGTPFFVVIGFPKAIRDKIFGCIIFPRRRRKEGNSTSVTATTKAN